MRTLVWIVLAGFATQLPARDAASWRPSSGHVRACPDKAATDLMPATGDPVLPFMRLSQSVA
jgi:hypothetical protein